MTALKTADIDAFVARPDKKFPIVLICGPDAGLVWAEPGLDLTLEIIKRFDAATAGAKPPAK